MRTAMAQLGMSACAFHRVLKLAMTITDLAGANQIQAAHLAEAIHLRSTQKTRVGNKRFDVSCKLTTGL
jgi:magnesium chelatase family protein